MPQDIKSQDDSQPVQNDTTESVEESKQTEPKSERKYTDEDVNRIIDEKFAKWQAKQDKKQEEAERLAGLSDAEKSEELRKQADARANELQAKLDRVLMRQTTTKMLSDASMPVSDEIVDLITTNEAESTKKNVDTLVAYGKQVEESVKKEYLRGNPQTSPGHPINGGAENLGERLAKEANEVAKRKNPYFK